MLRPLNSTCALEQLRAIPATGLSTEDLIRGRLFVLPSDKTIDLLSHRFSAGRLIRIHDCCESGAFLASEQGAVLPPPRNGIGIRIRPNDGIVGRAEVRGVRLLLSTEEGGVGFPSGTSLSTWTRAGMKEASKKAGTLS
jgi:hypothetical protein